MRREYCRECGREVDFCLCEIFKLPTEEERAEAYMRSRSAVYYPAHQHALPTTGEMSFPAGWRDADQRAFYASWDAYDAALAKQSNNERFARTLAEITECHRMFALV